VATSALVCAGYAVAPSAVIATLSMLTRPESPAARTMLTASVPATSAT
jgi:hypothetical protein